MLWVAVHLPLLSLESFAATLPAAMAAPPRALEDEQRIVSANAPARQLGVKPGLKRATALALAPGLTLAHADPRRDACALDAVAHTALAFTPNVTIQPANDAAGADATAPDTVLLEVQGSLRYFGGLERLLQRLQRVLAPLGHRLHLANAPTALGAALLARVHRRFDGIDLPATQRSLDAAPVWLLGPGRAHWEALQGMGLRVLADLRALPRSGVARRFGAELLDELDRAYGAKPDPRVALVPPPAFESRLELFARADSAEQVLHGAGILLDRLIAWLAAQHAFVRRFTLVMQHEPRWRRQDDGTLTPPETALELALAEPSRERAHLLALLRERLARFALPAPTLELRLHAADIAQRAAPNVELFPTPRSEREGLLRLIERLQARLGHEKVQSLAAVDDHRPELATVVRPADARVVSRGRGASRSEAAQASPTRLREQQPAVRYEDAEPAPGLRVRPVWLMASEGEPLQKRDAQPLLDGRPLLLVSGPERIESGWWDMRLVERDYFIAQQPDGALVWIYRTRQLASKPSPGWFLQGRFG
jgi:protein ImuB